MLLIYLVIVSLLSSCLHRISYTDEQMCAGKGMLLESASMGTARGQLNVKTENLHCRRPGNLSERCEVKEFQKSRDPVAKVNASSIKGKNFLIGTGYLAFIVPGVVLSAVFNSSRDHAIEKSRIDQNVIDECHVLSDITGT